MSVVGAAGSSDLLRRESNVVLSFDNTPTTQEVTAITRCLSTAKSAPVTTPPLPAPYPTEFVNSFMGNCTKSTSEGNCRCVLNHAEAQYSYTEFVQLSRAVSDPSSPDYERAQALLAGCR